MKEENEGPAAPASEEDAPLPIPMGKTPEPPSRARSVNRRRTLLIVTAPIVSVATLMLGLRVGAGDAVRSATIFVAPPGRAASGKPTPFAWQVLTYLEDRGVRETVGMDNLSVTATSKGKVSEWSGASNMDGIAEVVLGIPDYQAGDPIDIVVRRGGESSPLASGTVTATMLEPKTTWARRKEDPSENRGAVRPSKREGPYQIDLVLEGDRLVVGFQNKGWVHVAWPRSDLDAARGVKLDYEPEPGLLAAAGSLGCNGWSEVHLEPQAHVVGLKIEARDRDREGAHDPNVKGTWFGAVPVAFGAFYPAMKDRWSVDEPVIAHIAAPNPRKVVYAEVNDESGRVFAAALPLSTVADPTSGFAPSTPHARLEVPALAPGLHWLVVSGEPRGAEHLSGATIARGFIVGPAPDASVNIDRSCSIGPWLAQHPAVGFPRNLALDGMATRGASNRTRHRAGLAIGLLSLLIAAVLEVLLLTAAAREARAVMLLAELEDDPKGTDHQQITAKPPGGGVVIGVLVALLGFALLGALMIAKG